MKKVLYVASVTSHITKFHIPYLKLFHKSGYEVHVASNGNEPISNCDKHFQVPFERFPLKLGNFKAYRELKKILEKENYKTIVCHTPAASMITRLAARKARKKGTRVVYMAHGFHFYRGAPKINWIIYYPIEWLLSKLTDDIITVNSEDYEFAKNNFKTPKIHFVHEVGVDQTKFMEEVPDTEKERIYQNLQITKNDFVLFFAGELNKNKNQITLIEAMKELVPYEPRIKLLLAGGGPLEDFFRKKIAEYNLENNVFLIGYRNDIPKILSITNLYISMSKREGLGLNVVEALIKKLPVIVSDNRGHRDIVKNDENGYIIPSTDVQALQDKIKFLYHHPEKRESFSQNAWNGLEQFYLENTMEEIKKVLLSS